MSQERMTLPEFTARMRREYEAAGFIVIEYCGFPVVKVRHDFSEMKRFFDFKPSLAVDISIYAEGALLTPQGLGIGELEEIRAKTRSA